MKYITKEVEISLDDFDLEDLIEFIEANGYEVRERPSNCALAPDADLAYRALRGLVPNRDAIIEAFILDKAGRVQ